MNILIQGGRLIDPSQQLDDTLDLYISDGKVAAIGTAPAGFVADQTIDASGQIVAPGFVDLCANVREPGYTRKGSIATEADAAVAGGVTTLITPPDTQPIIDTPAVAEMIRERAEDVALANVLPMGALTRNLDGQQLAPMFALESSGCIAFTNLRRPIENALVMMRCFEYAATHDLLVVIQPQEHSLAKGGCMHDDTNATRMGLNGIPETAETIEVSRTLLLVEQTGVRVHFGQLSCSRSVQMVIAARERGLPVTADVAIHHLLLTDDNVNGFDSAFHLIPPLRSQLDRAGLRHGLLSGGIQAICSDHQPHETAAKQAPFADTDPGMTGLETLLPLSLLLVEESLLTLPQLIDKLSTAPASVIGLDRGTLAAGKAADVVVFDPQQSWTLTPQASRSRGKNTPFMGVELKGRVTHTLVAGRHVYQLH